MPVSIGGRLSVSGRKSLSRLQFSGPRIGGFVGQHRFRNDRPTGKTTNAGKRVVCPVSASLVQLAGTGTASLDYARTVRITPRAAAGIRFEVLKACIWAMAGLNILAHAGSNRREPLPRDVDPGAAGGCAVAGSPVACIQDISSMNWTAAESR